MIEPSPPPPASAGDSESCKTFLLLLQDVDEAHYAYSFKYLKNKPVKELRDEQFLKISLAREESLLTIDISVDMKGVDG